MNERPMGLQEHPIGISPVREVRGGCPKDVIIEVDLRRNGNYESVNWRKCSGQEGQHGQRPHGPRIMSNGETNRDQRSWVALGVGMGQRCRSLSAMVRNLSFVLRTLGNPSRIACRAMAQSGSYHCPKETRVGGGQK